MITTRWVKINESFEYRFVGPKWIAFVIAKTDGRKINPLLRPAFHFACKVWRAKLQYRVRQ